eukprot:COSAG01_NODE_22832_length_831_cov_1.852703_2_plen_170_part_00
MARRESDAAEAACRACRQEARGGTHQPAAPAVTHTHRTPAQQPAAALLATARHAGVMAEEERRAQAGGAGGGDGGPSSGDAIPLSGVVGGAKGSPDAGGTGAAGGAGDAGGGEGQLRQRAGNSSGQKPSSSLRSKSYSETKSRSRDTRSGGKGGMGERTRSTPLHDRWV